MATLTPGAKTGTFATPSGAVIDIATGATLGGPGTSIPGTYNPTAPTVNNGQPVPNTTPQTYVDTTGATRDNATGKVISSAPQTPSGSAAANTNANPVLPFASAGSAGTNPMMPSAGAVQSATDVLSQTPEQIRQSALAFEDQAVARSQSLIDEIERGFNAEISTAAGNAAAASAAAGMAGSPQGGETTAAAMQPGIEARGKAVAGAIEAIQNIAQTQFQNAQAQGTANAQDTINLFKSTQSDLVNTATSMWQSGYTPDQLKTSNPDEYGYLLKYAYNGDPNAMNSAYVAAAKANLMNNGQPVYQAGGSLVFAQMSGVNPDGTPKVNFIPVSLPSSVPQGYKMQSNNQTSMGQVFTTFAPTDPNGNVVLDPNKPNMGIITFLNGKQIGTGGANDNTNPILSGQTIGSVTLGTVPNGVSETSALAGEGIRNGSQPPVISGSMSGGATQIKGYLSANGYDLTKASLDWQAISKYVTTLNSATQVRFRQAVQSIPNMLPNAQSLFDKLQGDMKNTTTLPPGLTVLNKANLELFKSGAYGPQLQSDAVTLDQQITDITSELGVVYKGGNMATDQALQTGAQQLSGSWDPDTFKSAIQLITQNMDYRKNAVLNAGVAGTSDNQYSENVPGGTASAGSGSGSTTQTYPAGTVLQDSSGAKYVVGADGVSLTPQ